MPSIIVITHCRVLWCNDFLSIHYINTVMFGVFYTLSL